MQFGTTMNAWSRPQNALIASCQSCNFLGLPCSSAVNNSFKDLPLLNSYAFTSLFPLLPISRKWTWLLCRINKSHQVKTSSFCHYRYMSVTLFFVPHLLLLSKANTVFHQLEDAHPFTGYHHLHWDVSYNGWHVSAQAAYFPFLMVCAIPICLTINGVKEAMQGGILETSGSYLRDFACPGSSTHNSLQSRYEGPKHNIGSWINSLLYKYFSIFFSSQSFNEGTEYKKEEGCFVCVQSERNCISNL